MDAFAVFASRATARGKGLCLAAAGVATVQATPRGCLGLRGNPRGGGPIPLAPPAAVNTENGHAPQWGMAVAVMR